MSAAAANMITITKKTGDRYLLAILNASVIRCRSGPVKGVTRFARSTPLIIPSTSQKIARRVLIKTLRRTRYTNSVVVKIRKEL